MAMSISVGEPFNFISYEARFVTVTGDNSAQYIATGTGQPLKGAILVGATDGDITAVELNTADSSATTNGTLYWPTAIGNGVTATYIIYW